MMTWPRAKDPFPLVELAKYHEHRLKDFTGALDYVNRALGQVSPDRWRETEQLLRRRQRLEGKGRGA
jgi:hypothetical protein